MERAKIVLKSGKDQSLQRFHPWVFSGAIKKIYGTAREGEVVDVFNNKDEYLASGHYQESSIAVRVLSFKQEEIDEAFWKTRIKNAFEMRKRAELTDNKETNVYRLICAEGDFLPGLIVDYYNGTAVMQMHSAGMYLQREMIAEALKEVIGEKLKCIYNKSESSIPFKSGIEPKNEYIFGKPETKEVIENGHRFFIDWEKGQKTGFFIDQRGNRKLLRDYSANRKVLNMFGYTGGFSVYAMAGDASLVHSVDSSAKAIDLTDKNIELNFGNDSRHQSFAVDAFEFFNSSEEKYDLIILDPPAFAKHHNVLNNALQGYKKLNRRAIEIINPGGIIFTFSCSQVVSKENFKKSVFVAAANTGRQVRILHQLTQPVDHPVNIYHPEGEYLKGLVLQID
jgi:23S rRNA (cytosine1962-C5)-methyltransferase